MSGPVAPRRGGWPRRIFGGLMIAAALADAAAAQAPLSTYVGQLEAQGYDVVDVERTLLGRIRLLAVQGGNVREVVFDRTTGEILRDLVRPGGAAGGRRYDDGDDDDDDDDGDDDDD